MTSLLTSVRRSGKRAARLAFGAIRGPYARERRQVEAGLVAYEAAVRRSAGLYQLRRHVHMIEKGLSMRPRRPVFALDYIESTVETYLQFTAGAAARSSGTVTAKRTDERLGSGEQDWMRSVLFEYFVATEDSANELLVELRTRLMAAEPADADVSRGPHKPDVSAPPVDGEALLALAERRRSVRWFTDAPVPREVVDRAIRVASEAPTACNRQPYRFIVFDEPEEARRVAGVPMGTRGYAEQVRGIVVVVGDMSAFFDVRDRHLIYIDSCLASMGLLLGLESQGVGSCVINWPDMPDKEQQMRQLVPMSDHEKVIMLIAYGYADPEGLVPFSAKAEIDTVRTWGRLADA